MKKTTNQARTRDSTLTRQLWQLLGFLNRRRQRQLVVLFVLLVLSSLSEMVSLGALFPFLGALSNAEALLGDPQWQPLISWVNIQTTSQLVTGLAVAFIVTIVVAAGFKLLALTVKTRLAAAIGSDLSSQIYRNTLRQPYSFHVQHNSSDLIQMVTGDTGQLVSGVITPLLTLLMDCLLAPALIGALILIDGRIAISAAVILGIAYTLIYQQRKKLLRRNSQIATLAGQQRIKTVQEGIGGIRDVLLANTQDFFLDTYGEAERSFKRAKATNQLVASTPSHIIEAIAMAAIALLALTLGRDGDFSQAVPVLGSLALGAKRLLPTLQGAFSSFATMQGSRSSLERVLAALQRPVDPLLLLPTPAEPLFLAKELRLDNIWFRYGEDTGWILKGLDLTIAAKTTVAFVGSTGSGKSTTADLIMGLLQPQKGTIWVDGNPLEGERLRQWRQGIAHVPQSIFLTDATLAENIAFGVPKDQIDFDQVVKAAKLAQIDEHIRQLPAGYDTFVGERGIRLSGGQRQRVGIARALYRDASVIVFDEATSALDNATEQEVMGAIEGLSGEFTIILIAHRLSTVERCDWVFELEQGRLVAEGSYGGLIAQSASFRRMAGVG